MCLMNLNTTHHPHPGFLLVNQVSHLLMNSPSIFNILSSLQYYLSTDSFSKFQCFIPSSIRPLKPPNGTCRVLHLLNIYVILSDFYFSIFSATLLKLIIPRIKLLRNKKEVQLKHMRSDIAMLLEDGQETKASVMV